MFILQVLDFTDCESGLPVSAVLQPLTSICGVISVISSDFLMMFEKLLLWGNKMAKLDRGNARSEETCNLINELRFKPVSKPLEQPSYSEVFCRLTGSQNNLQGKLIAEYHVKDGFLMTVENKNK